MKRITKKRIIHKLRNSMFLSVTVILPTMNRKNSLQESLRSLYKMDYPKERLELIVIDNGSTDGTPFLVKEQFPQTKLITLPSNIGFAPALNLGIKKAKGSYIFITNDDVIFNKNCLSELVKLAQSDKTIGIIGGKMFFSDRPERMALPGFRVNIWLGYHPYDFTGENQVREMDVTTGGCMLIRKSMLKLTGFFDEGFFFCGEDYDLCFRARIAGFKVMYCPTALVWHKFLGSSTQSFNSLFAHYRGKFRFMLIHANFFQLFLFFPLQLVIGFRHVSPLFAALFWNIKNLPSALESRRKVHRLRELHMSLYGE